MAKVYAMYRTPADTAAFDRYYFATHVPIAKKIPGLRHYEVTSGPVATMTGASPYYLVAALTFDSMAAIQAALASPEGQATAADLGNFATAGVDLYFADTRDV
ncbi:MAG: EthD family reductase [Burkholderiales bacterium]